MSIKMAVLRNKVQRESPPLYVGVKQAAELCGVNEKVMREWVSRPYGEIPHLRVGNKRLIRVSAIAEYAIAQEAV